MDALGCFGVIGCFGCFWVRWTLHPQNSQKCTPHFSITILFNFAVQNLNFLSLRRAGCFWVLCGLRVLQVLWVLWVLWWVVLLGALGVFRCSGRHSFKKPQTCTPILPLRFCITLLFKISIFCHFEGPDAFGCFRLLWMLWVLRVLWVLWVLLAVFRCVGCF